jgi:hypothetical protein
VGVDGAGGACDRPDDAVAGVGQDPLAARAPADDGVAAMAVADGDQVVARPGAHRSVAEEIDELVVAWPARHHVAAAVAVDVVVAAAAENPVVTPGALQQNLVRLRSISGRACGCSGIA